MDVFDKKKLARSIHLADAVTQKAELAKTFQQECTELKTKAKQLSALLHVAATSSYQLYQQPTRRIIQYAEIALDQALILIIKSTFNQLLFFFLNPKPNKNSFLKTSKQLQNSIQDLTWLGRISIENRDDVDEHLGIPPIASGEPILGVIWEQVANLHKGTLEERSEAAGSLALLARDNGRYGKLMVEEGGCVGGLLKLGKEGEDEGKAYVARCIGYMSGEATNVEAVVNYGGCGVFAKMLEHGNMKVRYLVAWVVSEMAKHYPKCQYCFAQNDVVRLLVAHLAFQLIQQLQHNNNRYEEDDKQRSENQLLCAQMHNVVTSTLSAGSIEGGEYENPITKLKMKAMAARALWHLCKGNVAICRNIITDHSIALSCLAILLKDDDDDIKYYSSMALMEIAAMVDQNVDQLLRQFGFEPTSPLSSLLFVEDPTIVPNQKVRKPLDDV